MRVLFVGTNSGGGGTESHLIALARALAETGHDVAAAVRPDDFIHRGLSQDARIRLFPAEFRTRRDLPAVRELAKLARALRPDWIVGAFKLEYWGIAAAAKSAGIPLVLFSHLDQRIRPVMLHRFTRLVRGVIVPSHYLRQRTIERGLCATQVAVLPNPIDVEHYKPNAALCAKTRAELGLYKSHPVFGYVGRFEPDKGVATLGKALNLVMANHEHVHALWVGHGQSEHALRELTGQAGCPTRHHWMPWLDDVLPAYAAMDTLALPSEGRETFGRVLVEAQAHGLPVLGSRIGGIPEALADGETGRLVPPGDVPSWARAIAELTCDHDLRRRLGGSAREFALRFDSHRIAAEFPQVLESFDPTNAVPEIPRALPVTLAGKIPVD
jgi:glycosyltransferase involved in cell wall biosynthesis